MFETTNQLLVILVRFLAGEFRASRCPSLSAQPAKQIHNPPFESRAWNKAAQQHIAKLGC